MSEEKIINAGNVKISEDVVASIVTIAVNEVEGAHLAPAAWGKKGSSRGVRIVVEEKVAAVDVCLEMSYGVKIPQTALKVQQKVKEAIESMTGLTVGKINITVSGVSFDKEKKGE